MNVAFSTVLELWPKDESKIWTE
uniref:Uncharacterized protein n=1 Tax=Lepeophtheirus salmonis TaxID=72036 RepID=A0A0K2TBZ6_LEPSM